MVIVVILSRDTPKPTKNGRGKEGKDRKRNVATINGQEEVNSTRYSACSARQINKQ